MTSYDELNNLKIEKARILAQENAIREKRKAEIGQLAEYYGILSLPDDTIQSAFKNIYNQYQK